MNTQTLLTAYASDKHAAMAGPITAIKKFVRMSPKTEVAKAHKFHSFDRVAVLWNDGGYWLATVLEADHAKVELAWDNGEFSTLDAKQASSLHSMLLPPKTPKNGKKQTTASLADMLVVVPTGRPQQRKRKFQTGDRLAIEWFDHETNKSTGFWLATVESVNRYGSGNLAGVYTEIQYDSGDYSTLGGQDDEDEYTFILPASTPKTKKSMNLAAIKRLMTLSLSSASQEATADFMGSGIIMKLLGLDAKPLQLDKPVMLTQRAFDCYKVLLNSVNKNLDPVDIAGRKWGRLYLDEIRVSPPLLQELTSAGLFRKAHNPSLESKDEIGYVQHGVRCRVRNDRDSLASDQGNPTIKHTTVSSLLKGTAGNCATAAKVDDFPHECRVAVKLKNGDYAVATLSPYWTPEGMPIIEFDGSDTPLEPNASQMESLILVLLPPNAPKTLGPISQLELKDLIKGKNTDGQTLKLTGPKSIPKSSYAYKKLSKGDRVIMEWTTGPLSDQGYWVATIDSIVHSDVGNSYIIKLKFDQGEWCTVLGPAYENSTLFVIKPTTKDYPKKLTLAQVDQLKATRNK